MASKSVPRRWLPTLPWCLLRSPDGTTWCRRLEENIDILAAAYRLLAADIHAGTSVAPAAEWLLDNYHLVSAEALAVRRDLPRRYYRTLPKLAARDLLGRARTHQLAIELIRHGDGRIDAERLTRFVMGFQTVAPLTIGELWALPSMLKLALLENLRILIEGILEGRTAREDADRALARLEKGLPMFPLPEPLLSAFVARLRHECANTTRGYRRSPPPSSLHWRTKANCPRRR